MNRFTLTAACLLAATAFQASALQPPPSASQDGVTVSLLSGSTFRSYQLSTTLPLRDNKPPGGILQFSEAPGHATLRSGNLLFDSLYALAVFEALQDSVPAIRDGAYSNNNPIQIDAFQTGELWAYVWTRDLSYSVFLALGQFDPQRAVNSLLFKTSPFKSSVIKGFNDQIVQDTGSGGSYPISTDRVTWALGASRVLLFLQPAERQKFLATIYPILCSTIEQDRRLVFDPADGLYRGEQSFLDWREQTYPAWTRDNVLAIGCSKALSTNCLHYNILKTAADFARQLGQQDAAARYRAWADALRTSINQQFFDPAAGLYSTFFISDNGAVEVRAPRYDLMGESLAIITGIADPQRAAAVIAHYPTGPYGPPVVWPEEKTIGIYHNQAIWPFATAYWVKAARLAGNYTAVDAGAHSLESLAARNLSNMENYDFLTGSSHVTAGPRTGPAVDSRRQLWSVAAYLSLVQDIIFGIDVSPDGGVRCQPFVTAAMRDGFLAGSDSVELNGWTCRGASSHFLIHLPPAHSFKQGVCRVRRVLLNGKSLKDGYAKLTAPSNDWEIFLEAPGAIPTVPPPAIRILDPQDSSAVFAPAMPQWTSLAPSNGHLVLQYRDSDPGVSFNIYRDGFLRASGVRDTFWSDQDPAGSVVHTYSVAAVDPRSGNVSHFTPQLSSRAPAQDLVILARSFQNCGGRLVNGHHFENWGLPADELAAQSPAIPASGRYSLRVEFSNGAGPINTGVTCAVKRLELTDSTGRLAAAGYFVMPQSGSWTRWDLSSSIPATLTAGERYHIRIFEDPCSRNMSYLESNKRYTALPGGGDSTYNFVDISAIHLLYMNPAATSAPGALTDR